MGQRSQEQSIATSSSESGTRLSPASAKTDPIPAGMRPSSSCAT